MTGGTRSRTGHAASRRDAEVTRGLAGAFLSGAEAWPDRPALEVDGQVLTYRSLQAAAQGIAATIQHHADDAVVPRLTAVFGRRSATTFTGVLGALMAGRGYVPLNPAFPIARTRSMLQRSECPSLVVAPEAYQLLVDVLEGHDRPVVVLLPDAADVCEWRARLPRHTVLGLSDLCPAEGWRRPSISSDDIAYLLFTSGSTGVPKAVMVTHFNALSFLARMQRRYSLTPEDRCSQMFELTFDPSVFDMFVTWQAGACLFCPRPKELINPAGFIRRSRLTLWFSVPSVAIFMKQLGVLKPGSYPTLRWSLFAGEALPEEVVGPWSQAAPSSVLDNLYGPTELTVVCTGYRWDPRRSPFGSHLGIVPIGQPFDGMTALVVNSDMKKVDPGEPGELLVTGPQLTPGYWQDAQRTSESFVVPPGHSEVYYRTGDLVIRGSDGVMHYVGRCDNQVKVNGHRVELGEVEAALRKEPGIDAAVALGWPRTQTGAGGIVAFVEGSAVDTVSLRRRVASGLPDYMVPRAIHVIARLPLNVNGKYDRQALVDHLESIS